MNDNHKPVIHDISVHNVQPAHVKVKVRLFDTFGTVRLHVGDFRVTLFTDTVEEAVTLGRILGHQPND